MNARFLRVALPLILGLVFASTAMAQDQVSDDAKALLKQGLAQYKALDFKSAQATLLKAKDNEKSLDATEQKALNDTLDKVGGAAKQQAADREAYDAAEAALKSGELGKAKLGFEKAAASEFLPDAERKDARAQLATVVAKLKEAKTPATDTAIAKVTDPTPGPDTTPAVETKPAPDTAPVAQTKPAPDTPSNTAIETLEANRAAQVKQLIADGNAAMQKCQADQAVAFFERAVALDKDNAEAQALLAKAQAQVAAPATPLDQLAQERIVKKQMVTLEFEKNIKQATELDAKARGEGANGDKMYGQARDAANAAKKIAEDNKELLGATESQNRISQADSLLKLIAADREAWNISVTRQQMAEAEKANQERIRLQEQAKREKIAALTARVKTLQSEGKPKEALDVLDQIIALEPGNKYAAGARDTLAVFTNLRTEGDLLKIANDQMTILAIDNREAEIPWHVLVRFPDNWRDMSARRKEYSAENVGESKATDEVRQKIRAKIGKVDFVNQPFQDVVQFFREVSGANFHVNWAALTAGGIDKTTQVNLNLSEITVETALQLVLGDLGQQTKLGYVIKDGVVTISTKDDLAKTPVVRVYDIRDLLVRIPMFNGPVINLGGINGCNTSCCTTTCDNGQGCENENWVTKAEMINAIVNTVQSTIDKDSWVPTGTVGSIREYQGSLVISQTLENQQAVANLIAQLRETQSMQVNIEARFISVSTGFLDSVGMNLDLFFNLGSGLGGGRPTTTPPTPIPPGDGNNFTLDPFTGAHVPYPGTSGWGSGTPGNQHWTPIGIVQQGGQIGFGNMLGVSTPAPSSIGTQVTSPGISVGGVFLDDVQVNFLVQATQANSLTRTLTAPILTLFNGQKSYVTVGAQQAYVASFDPIVSDNSTAFRPVIQYLPVGSTLAVEATVSADRRYVTMTVEPQVTSNASLTSVNVGQGTVQLPNVTVQQLKTTVMVPDGGTLLLGGQRVTAEVEREGGVPVLSHIPVIDRLFTNRGKVRDEQTLLILIKPKIIIPREEESLAFPTR